MHSPLEVLLCFFLSKFLMNSSNIFIRKNKGLDIPCMHIMLPPFITSSPRHAKSTKSVKVHSEWKSVCCPNGTSCRLCCLRHTRWSTLEFSTGQSMQSRRMTQNPGYNPEHDNVGHTVQAAVRGTFLKDGYGCLHSSELW